MYYKIVNDREVFSPCKKLYIKSEDRWVSNPPEEMILAQGWLPVPPAPPYVPQPQTEPDYDQVIQAVKKFLSSETEDLTDEDALSIAALYDTWASQIGKAVAAGKRLWYDGKLYKTLQPHTVQEDWTPDNTPALFAEVSIVEWPEFVQPTGAQDAYNTGDKMTFNGEHYVSLIDGNVWSPADYPAGWEKQP